MRVLVITSLYPPNHRGGYGILSHRVTEGVRKSGMSVKVLTASPSCFPPADSSIRVEEDVERTLLWHSTQQLAPLMSSRIHNLRATARAISSFRPDVIYFQNGDGLGLDVYNYAASRGVPTAVLVGDTWLAQAWRNPVRYDAWTGLTHMRSEESLPRRAARQGLRIASGVLNRFQWKGASPAAHVHAISQFLIDDLDSAGVTPLSTPLLTPYPLPEPFINSAGEPVGRLDSSSTALRALFVSRIEYGKGPDTAIQAVAAARKKGIDIRLTLAGFHGQSIRSELTELARSLEVGDRVEWATAPDSESLCGLYRSHDVFLFPTRIVEGFGIVNAEAMACGLPVIGVASGGAADVIVDGRTGFRINPDEPEVIASHLTRLSRDRELLLRLSAGAIEMSRRHAPARVVPFIADGLRAIALESPATRGLTAPPPPEAPASRSQGVSFQ